MFVATFFLNFAYVNGDEDTDIEALPTSVNFRSLVLSYNDFCNTDDQR